MSNGGSYELITNDGKIDKLLLANDLLVENLAKIVATRREMQSTNPNPTISDLEKTHIVHFYNSFSPYVAVAYEYIKTQQNGTPTPSGTVSFNIPLVGDLYTDALFKTDIGAINASNSNESDRYVRYVDNLSDRLFSSVRYSVNGNKIDEYDQIIPMNYRKWRLMPWKEAAYNRLTGQENAIQAYGHSIAGNGDVRLSTSVVNGLQTPKETQPAHTIYTPILFWWCFDSRDSIPSVCIPYGQRLIDATIAPTNQFVQHVGINASWSDPSVNPVSDPNLKMDMWINNLYVQAEVHDILIQQIAFSLCRIYRQQKADLRNDSERVQLTAIKWPVETLLFQFTPIQNMSVNSPKMLTDWYIGAFVTEEVFRECCAPNYAILDGVNLTAATQLGAITRTLLITPGNITLSNGFDVTAAILASAATNPYLPVLPGDLITSVAQLYNVLEFVGYANIFNWDFVNFNVAPLTTTLGTLITTTECTLDYKTQVRPVDNITLVSHGVILYNGFPSAFYDSYLPWKYGCTYYKTTTDIGNFLIHFALKPGEAQPSGHFNFSRARETYIETTSTLISSNNPVSLYVQAICLNFSLISDGTQIIRYGT